MSRPDPFTPTELATLRQAATCEACGEPKPIVLDGPYLCADCAEELRGDLHAIYDPVTERPIVPGDDAPGSRCNAACGYCGRCGGA